jgi:hypothetical protein
MFIRAMDYPRRFGIDTKKIEPTRTFMRPPWKEMDEDRIDLILTRIPKGSGSERFRREAAKIIQEKYERHVKTYADGSKKDERAGYAVITLNRNYRRRVQQQSTVFSTAIWLTEGAQRDKVIITDSLSTLTAINSNIKLREMIDRNKKQITLVWVPGHMGIPGNEQADDEAKAALDDDIQQNKEYPQKHLEKWLKTETTKIRKEQWRNGSNNMKGRKIEHKYDGDTRGMMRKEQVVISSLRTGYTRATHGPGMNGITDPQCPFCDTGLTVDHVLWDCTETEQTKREVMMTPEIWTRGAEGMKKIIYEKNRLL